MRRMNEVNDDKWLAVARLKAGDVVLLTDNSEAAFVKMKQKNFEGIINGVLSNIPINMFVKLVQSAGKNEDYKNMEPNEPFYINKDGKALLFTFVGIEGGRIVGINPVSKGKTRIDAEMFAGRVRDL